MKPHYYLFLASTLLLASCANQNRVTKITFDNETHTSTFHGEVTEDGQVKEVQIKQDDAFVREGSDIQIIVQNFNPMNHEFTLQQENDVLYYTAPTAQTNALTSFIAAANGQQVINPAPNNPNKKDTNDPAKCLLISDVNQTERTLLNSIDLFHQFYNAIVALNNKIDSYKAYPKLNKVSLHCDLDNAVNAIKSNYVNASRISGINCSGNLDNYVFVNSAEANNFSLQKDRHVADIQTKIDELEKNIAKNKASATKCLGQPGVLSSTLDKSIARAKALKDEINTKLSSNIDIVATKLSAINALQFTFSPSRPHVGETDELVLKISVKDNVKNNTIVYNLAHLPVYKSIKIDYSAGAFFTGLYDESFTKTVSTTTDNTVDPPLSTNHYTLHRFDGGGLSYGAMAFINFHTQLACPVNYGISLGGGLRFNQSTKFVLAPTGSLLFGKYQRLIVHMGYAISQVDRIYSAYGDESFTDSNYAPDIKQVVKGSFIFAISWNLSRTK